MSNMFPASMSQWGTVGQVLLPADDLLYTLLGELQPGDVLERDRPLAGVLQYLAADLVHELDIILLQLGREGGGGLLGEVEGVRRER